MGGMIAQTLAARRPRQVHSLVSIMSNTGSVWTGQPALRLYPYFLRRPAEGRAVYVAHMERLFAAIGSTGLPRATAHRRANARRPRNGRSTCRPLGRAGHDARDQRGEADERKGHGPRPAPCRLAQADRSEERRVGKE